MSPNQELEIRFPVENEKTKIRVFEERDICVQYIGWLNDKEVVRFSNQRFICHDRKNCKDYFDSIDEKSWFLLVENKKDGLMLGTISVHFNLNHGVADIGILIGEKSSWGKGVGGDAWSAVVDILAGLKGIRKITAGTLACNLGMISIMKKCGMEADGYRRAQEECDDDIHDILYFAKYIK